MEEWGRQYDAGARMIRRPFSSPGYHTRLKGGDVHPTRDSLSYAVALLNTGEPDVVQRAEEIPLTVIALQDQDPASKTYGIWSWFLEEPLAEMSPPDWNWADFCGVQLLEVALDHGERISPRVLRKVEEAIVHAARSIQRRNAGPGYTNIAIMGTYVTLAAAELYGIEDLRQYALKRLETFHSYTEEQGGFSEYNSPTYTVVALREIGRLRRRARNPEAKRLAEGIYRRAWEEIALHFHAPSAQWAGPHSRCYQTLLTDKTKYFLQRSTGVKLATGNTQPAPEDFNLPLPCPDDLRHWFKSLPQSATRIQEFTKGEFPVVGTTYLAPKFTLGTVNREDLWNQRRPLIAYWGAEEPAFLRLRYLHDDYDFADAQFLSTQSGGTALAAVVLATDGGDTHVSLDRIKNSTVAARDLRLRFEFGGAAAKSRLSVPVSLQKPFRQTFGEVEVQLQMLYAELDGQPGRFESGADPLGNTCWIDVVFHEGESREFRLDKLKSAAAAFCLSLGAPGSPAPQPTCTVEGQVLILKSRTPALALRSPVSPAKASQIRNFPQR